MAVRELTAPPTSRSRKPKYPYTDKEVKDAVSMLKAGKNPGVGPYEAEGEGEALAEARSAIQSLARYIKNAEPDLNIGTQAWETEDGAFAILKVK